MSDLIIVESPTKVKSIKEYLGSGYEVVASKGHVRDLPKSKLGIDVENDFEPSYINMKDKGDVIKMLKSAAKKCDKIYLAADPDREGEAISWHIANLLGIDTDTPTRITFNEITKHGVTEGMAHPRTIDMKLVDSQQARRVLDRLVGYKISPFLWRKVSKGLSAGRVQSVAVRLIVDREEEIRNFKSDEYWSVDAKLKTDRNKTAFSSKLHSRNDKKVELKTEADANVILDYLKDKDFVITGIKKSVKRKNPAPPFITSTLQQEASKRFGWQGTRTMQIAQQLYEGIEISGHGTVGLITYMRTDSLRISDEATAAASEFILNTYGKEYIPSSPRKFKMKNGAQDAHEAIRPTDVNLVPKEIKESLSNDQFKLYKVIWERFLASQMSTQLLDTVSVDISAGDCLFKSSGTTVKFKGYAAVYEEAKEDDDSAPEKLPQLNDGEKLNVEDLKGEQHFTQPPARYTDYSLIKVLEEKGVGRPGTYAPIIATIIARNYVEREQKKFKPTILGEVTTQLMKDYFSNIVDVDFTAQMEKQLDDINDGDIQWKDVIRNFYSDFEETLKKAEEDTTGKRIKIPDEETDVVCELCGKNMVIKNGRFGKFLACPGFPDCKNTKKIIQETKGVCPLCGGTVIEKKSKRGRKFYGCKNYPECNFMTWDIPLEDKCPKCGSTLFKKGTKDAKIVCHKEDCGYETDYVKKSED